MARFIPNVVLIAISAFAFLLWHLSIYPFSDSIFSYEGYAMHFFVGIAWTALQVAYVQLRLPRLALRMAGHALVAFCVLLALELGQFFIPSRHVQWEDIVAQTAGIAFTLLILKWYHVRFRP